MGSQTGIYKCGECHLPPVVHITGVPGGEVKIELSAITWDPDTSLLNCELCLNCLKGGKGVFEGHEI